MSVELFSALVRSLLRGGAAPRAALGLTVAALVAVLPAETQNAVANGDTRTIQLYHAHTHESISATYLVNGSYDQSVLEKLNWFLRDWRRDEPTKMDPRLFDVIWEVYRESGSQQPVEVMSAYRSPETNAMLRRRSRGVAEHSQHILGKAMDQHYMDVPMSRIRELAMRLQRGGVGFYPTAGTPFVHMDVGGVRHWPRMSYDQLARLFPDGKTVHIPSNGQPLPGYELARAELESRGDSSYPTASQLKTKGFFAWLFGGSDEEEDAAAEGGGRTAAPSRNTRVAMADRTNAPAALYSAAGKDGGMHSFLANQSPQPAPTTPYGKVARDAEPLAPASAPVAPPPPPPAPAPMPVLASTATEFNEPAAVPSRAVPDPVVMAQGVTSTGLAVPMPPRRPMELASNDELPLPPPRPAELNRPIEAPAPTPGRAGHGDAIGAILNSRMATGPGAGLRGSGSTPQMLAYADESSLSAASSRPGQSSVPLPVPRPPDLVGARLDRGNFGTLTSSGKADRAAGGSSLGVALGVRAAARASSSGYGPSAVQSNFGNRASPLDTDRFTGKAVKDEERLVTYRRADASSGRNTAD